MNASYFSLCINFLEEIICYRSMNLHSLVAMQR